MREVSNGGIQMIEETLGVVRVFFNDVAAEQKNVYMTALLSSYLLGSGSIWKVRKAQNEPGSG